MHVRGTVAWARPGWALLVAVLALLVAGTDTALAGGGGSSSPVESTPREQNPGDPTGFGLPFAPGHDVEVLQGWSTRYSHYGRNEFAYDFGLLDGTPVLAAASGTVSHVHDGETVCGGAKLLRRANYVTIEHLDGSATLYAHLSTVDVAVGDPVAAGQEIGTSGRTGYTECRPHLHFARQVQGGPVTQSIPVYFEGFADHPLELGEVVRARAAACAGSPIVAEAVDDADAAEADAEPAANADAAKADAATAAVHAAPLGAFCAVYGPLDSQSPALFERIEQAIDFDWDTTPPGGYWLDSPAGGFSAHWSGAFGYALTGVYTFRLATTSAVVVKIDGGDPLAFEPGSSIRHVLNADVELVAGVHRIDVLAESGDGQGILRLDWHAAVTDRGAGHWARYLQVR